MISFNFSEAHQLIASNNLIEPYLMRGQSSQRVIKIYDHRRDRPNGSQEKYGIRLNDEINCEDVIDFVYKKINTRDFILTFVDRTPLDSHNMKSLENNDVLWILNDPGQKFRTTVALNIELDPLLTLMDPSVSIPRGVDSFVSTLTELIDHSIAATKTNNGLRSIQIRYYKDLDNEFKDSFVLIVDNGRGLDVNDLQNWSRLKFSKFEPTAQHHPRHLNSDLNESELNRLGSLFSFGHTLTILSKSNKSIDSVELTISRMRFWQNVHNRPIGSVYREPILIRSKGVEREVPNDLTPYSDSIITKLFEDLRKTYKSFTIIAIKDLLNDCQRNLQKNSADKWSKDLATIYHYYIHGPKGNICDEKTPIPSEPSQLKISIQLNSFIHFTSNGIPVSIIPNHSILLDKINDDFESQLVRSAADSFKFEILHYIKGGLIIEGIIRYHPYLYERETLPQLREQMSETSLRTSNQGYHSMGHYSGYLPSHSQCLGFYSDLSSNISHPKRKLFDVFWNGRLIPLESVDFDWSKYDSKNPNTKGFKDCFKRLSGALFSDSSLKITPNKQNLVDLNKLLVMKEYLSFYCVNENGKRLTNRINVENAFIKWIKSCHEKYDKEVMYQEFQGDISRNEFPNLMKSSMSSTDTYSTFNAIKWRNKVWRKGDIILTRKTKPVGLLGRIHTFLVPKCVTDLSGNYYGATALAQIHLIPEEVFGRGEDSSKLIFFYQINIEATDQIINSELKKIYERLPKQMEVTFPREYPLIEGLKIVSETPIGDMRVIIKNSRGERLKSDRIPYKSGLKTIKIQTEIWKIEGDRTVAIPYTKANYTREWDYWFAQKDDGIKDVGEYQLVCVCLLTDDLLSNNYTETFADGTPLPSSNPINFSVIASLPQ